MRVLVTGANGFIGHNVCAWLRNQGCYVIAVDMREECRTECDEYVCCNLASEECGTLLDNLKVDSIDALVHLAADMRHEPYTVPVVANNCVGTQRLLELCEAKKVPVYVQLSSLPVIGHVPTQHPITEDHPINPPTVYHVTKYMQELLADFASRMFGLRTVSFRITAPVGEGVNPKTIFPVFVRKAVNGETITLFGKGNREQTYVHVYDIAQAIYKAILSQSAQGVYILSSHNRLSNLELAKKCVELTGSSSEIVFTGDPDPLDDVVWDVVLDKIKKDMDYEPAISIDEAIREYAQIIRNEQK